MPKILLISDNEKLNKKLTVILAKSGIATLCSVDEVSIMNYVENALVSIVIVDEDIKKLDSLMICKKLQASVLKENITLISLVSAKTSNQDLLKITNAYIVKPINEKILSVITLL